MAMFEGVQKVFSYKAIACCSKLLFTLISAISQFERDCIADRTREGLSAARARGRKGGRPPISSELIDKAKRLYDTKEYTMSEIEELTGVKRATLY